MAEKAVAGLAHRFAGQLARPRGLAGRLLGQAMDIANREPTRWALDLLAARDGERVLDAGCGTGAALAELRKRARIVPVGIDPSQAMIAAARNRLGEQAELHAVDTSAMPFADGTFDAAIMLNVLYFCDAESRMVADVRRALRPGGRLVAYVTARKTMEGWPFARAGLHRLYDADQLRAALVKGGFATESIAIHARTVARGVSGLLAFAQR